MATEATSTVPAGTLPYSTRLVVDMILAAVQDTMSLYGHPALVDAGPMAGILDAPRGMTTAGTITVQINEAASAWDVAASETAYGTNKDIDPTYASFSTGNYDVAYGVSDDLRRRDATGLYNWPRIAQRIVTGWDVTFTGLVVALASSMTNSVGTTGNPITLDLIQDARDKIEVNGKSLAVGGFVCILAPQQWNMLRRDIQDRGGAVERRAEFDAMQMAGLGSYKGRYDGVDYYTSDQTAEASGDYSGSMFAAGGVGYLVLDQAPATPSQVRVLDAGIFFVEEIRTGKTTNWAGQASIGASIVRQELCCKILSTGRS